MKFTLFALLAVLCLVSVRANVEITATIEEVDFEYIAKNVAEDVVDIDTQVSWFGIYFVIHKALTTLKGVNCTIKEVYAIKAAAQNFVADVQACGGEVSKKLQQLIDTCNDIISTSNDIIHLNENICGNSADQDTSAVSPQKTTTPWKCFWKLLSKTLQLKGQVKKAIRLIRQIPSVPGDAGTCVNNALDTLSSAFNQFPSNVKTCSKLTKN
uniref:Protein TsetseEP domain-containing protein n=1 Tax=Stomoxys calcitrans TaxID=35570 RepID=A0A1I8NRZ1_STOCA